MADLSALEEAIRSAYRTRWLALGELVVPGGTAPLPELVGINASAVPEGAHQVLDIVWGDWSDRGTADAPAELGRGILQATTFVPAGTGHALAAAAANANRGVLRALGGDVAGLRVLSPDPPREAASGIWYSRQVDARFWWVAD